jgi:hypothetical protein
MERLRSQIESKQEHVNRLKRAFDTQAEVVQTLVSTMNEHNLGAASKPGLFEIYVTAKNVSDFENDLPK